MTRSDLAVALTQWAAGALPAEAITVLDAAAFDLTAELLGPKTLQRLLAEKDLDGIANLVAASVPATEADKACLEHLPAYWRSKAGAQATGAAPPRRAARRKTVPARVPAAPPAPDDGAPASPPQPVPANKASAAPVGEAPPAARTKMRVLLDRHAAGAPVGGSAEDRRVQLLEALDDPLPLRHGAFEPAQLAAAEAAFPWFAQVVRRMRESLELAVALGAEHAALRPLLVVGPAGTGKSRFCVALARALGRRLFVQPMAGLSEALSIVGCSGNFLGAQPSLPVRAFMETRQADPIVLLDELEKVGASTQHGHPHDALLPLLEPATAAAFRCAFLDRAVDASRIVYWATANAVGSLPSPLLSRFEVVHTPGPRPEHVPAIVAALRADMADEFGVAIDSVPDTSEILRRRLEDALGKSSDLRVLRRLWRDETERLLRLRRDGLPPEHATARLGA